MSKNILEVNNLSVSINIHDHIAYPVRELSFKLEAGKSLVIAGESGSGKTTAAYAMLGHYQDVECYHIGGSVLLDETPILDLSLKNLRNIWGPKAFMVVQDAMNALNPTMRVGRQICDILHKNKKMTFREAKTQTLDYFAQVGISDPVKTFSAYPHELSGGMCQRMIICMALAFSSSVIVADEPTTALDPVTAKETLALLFKTGKELQSGLVFISHDLETVSEYSDEILVMYAGMWAEKGKKDEILHSAAHPYTKGLLTSSQYPDSAKNGIMSAMEGTAPSVFAEISGCAFASRCPNAMRICFMKAPPARKLSETHFVCCHIGGDNDA